MLPIHDNVTGVYQSLKSSADSNPKKHPYSKTNYSALNLRQYSTSRSKSFSQYSFAPRHMVGDSGARNPEYTWRELSSDTSAQQSSEGFSIMSYNILAQQYIAMNQKTSYKRDDKPNISLVSLVLSAPRVGRDLQRHVGGCNVTLD